MDAPQFRCEKRAEGELPSITGYAALFDTPADLGYFTESIAEGAFKASIDRGDDVRALFNHDVNLIIGRTSAKTLELREDEKGLFCRIIPPDTSLGRDLVVSIERGDISQMSFGFYIEREESSYKDGKKPHFTILEARLFDVSPVTFPAYEETKVEIERSRQERSRAVMDHARAEHEKRSRSIKLFSLS